MKHLNKANIFQLELNVLLEDLLNTKGKIIEECNSTMSKVYFQCSCLMDAQSNDSDYNITCLYEETPPQAEITICTTLLDNSTDLFFNQQFIDKVVTYSSKLHIGQILHQEDCVIYSVKVDPSALLLDTAFCTDSTSLAFLLEAFIAELQRINKFLIRLQEHFSQDNLLLKTKIFNS